MNPQVIVRWEDGAERVGEIVEGDLTGSGLVVHFLDDPDPDGGYEFDRREGCWVEVNHMTVPVTIGLYFLV